MFGHSCQYTLFEPVGITSHVEQLGLSAVLYTPVAKEIDVVWQGWQGPGTFAVNRLSHYRIDPAWSEWPTAAIDSAFAAHATVWLAVCDGVAWLRAWCGTLGSNWRDLEINLKMSRFPICPGPRESGGGWLRSAGSDANEITSSTGLPRIHLWELAGFISRKGMGITTVETTVDSSNWSYNVSGERFMSWQNIPDASTLCTTAIFELPISVSKLISIIDGWAFGGVVGENPLICSVALRAEGMLRLRSIRRDTVPSPCRAIDLIILI